VARNVEIKARLTDFSKQFRLAETLAGQAGQRIDQRDIFFACEQGRMKLRIFSPQHGELIFYQRTNQNGPKTSSYFISRTDEPEVLGDVLDRGYGTQAVVKKTRWLFLVGRTRIHLDQVEDLGSFLELEVVLDEQDDLAGGEQEAEQLMQQLEIESASLVDCAYVDLLLAQ